jgi:prepilin-type processing-associated H-X9-DG protein/prepilin-type N-terminal cleavage/methylation domain-containing protein
LETRAPGHKRGAFTLVELLVVIGIIAVLMSILLPALRKARREARRAQCLSNVRQISMGAMLYWHESKGFSPYYNQGGNPWAGTAFQIEWFQQFSRAQEFDQVRLCPEAFDVNEAYLPAAAPTGVATGPNMPGTAFNHWGPYGQAMRYFGPTTAVGQADHMAGSYTANGYALKEHSSGVNGTLLNEAGQNDQTLGRQRLLKYPVRDASQTPEICDGIWPTAWIKSEDDIINSSATSRIYSLFFSAASDPQGPTAGVLQIGNDWRRIVVARHGFAINVAFADGHAETVKLPDLWKLKWHSQWNPNALPAGQTQGDIAAYLQKLYKPF